MSNISDKHQKLGGANGPLGAATGAETAAIWGGLTQAYQRGQIFFHADTGAHALAGDVLAAFLSAGGVADFGYPLEDAVSIAGGQAAYFERGCVWTGPQGTFDCHLSAPLIGHPSMLNPSSPATGVSVQFSPASIPSEVAAALWQNRILLQATGSPAQALALSLQSGAFVIAPNAGALQNRRLYNLAFRRSDGTTAVIAPHAFYARESWSNFGLIHATDIHVSRRLETYRQRLLDGAQPEGATLFECANDRLRDMIRGANALYRAGSLDLVLMTGDLVDFELETDDDPNGLGNYKLLRDLLLGKDASSDPAVASEELLVPVFTILGNHDYRRNPYKLFASVEILGGGVKAVDQYENHNLIEEDAFVLQGRRKISLSPGEALEMIRVDEKQKPYVRSINAQRSYVLTLGKNRIVMLDTRFDAGLPKALLSDDTGVLDNGALAGLSFDDLLQLKSGSPNLVGIVNSSLELLKGALSEAAGGGAVIVGVHAPPIDIVGGEYPWYFRETLRTRPEVVQEVTGFLNRHQSTLPGTDPKTVSKFNPDWLPSVGTQPAHFKSGDLLHLIDAGVSRGPTEEFMKLCAGEGSARAADIILCGHGHKHTEYRVIRDKGQFAVFTDFYSENPSKYYNTRSADGRSIYIDVAPGGDMKPVNKAWEPDFAAYWKMVTPPYATPLSGTSTSQQATEWWATHRPLVMQTSSLGLVESRQRVIFDNDSEPVKPPPTFQGYRVITVTDDTITRIQHVGQSPARRLRGWGRRIVTRQADTTGVAGEASAVKLLRLDAKRLVTVVRGGAGQLLLISWSALLGSKEPGTITRTGDSSSLAGKATDIDAVQAGAFVVTACRTGAGNLLLISWSVAANGGITRAKDSGSLAGNARMISVTALSSNLLVTACQNGDGNLLLITWKLGADGTLTRLGDSGSAAGEISALELVKVSGDKVVTAVRAGNSRLLLIAWDISTAGVIRRLSDTGSQAGEIDARSGISACIDNLGRVAISVRAGDGRLKLILWQLDPNGQLIRRGDSAGQAGKIGQHSLTAVQSSGDRSILVSAITTEAGTLKLITWDVTREGAIRRVAQTGGEAGATTLLAVVAGPLISTVPALGLGESFPIVTALRAGNGTLLLISWRANTPGLTVNLPPGTGTLPGGLSTSTTSKVL